MYTLPLLGIVPVTGISRQPVAVIAVLPDSAINTFGALPVPVSS